MILLQSLWDAIVWVGKISLIILPLTVGYQILRDNHWITERLRPYAGGFRKLGLGAGAVVPLVAGLVLGIVYGAGILIQESREGTMSRRDLLLMALFLCTCHAVIEDTLLFVVVGGNALWILGPRIVLAAFATALTGRLLRRDAPAVESDTSEAG